ncbi:hypothetical protein IF690_20715 [Pseudomonas sp. SK3(2021)]|uniref:hypothetical protein n=1 Tax=Pseudomonas sp. SK3(2021) TaxID=2841064 RepID=UPI00192CB24E|nr:hypothetical protein [Pseudomonas sp. SK3(2021)]QQZ40423.1 hypothetical protein IF690_20715 [Pseudomonas sp. SK3(2021)]
MPYRPTPRRSLRISVNALQLSGSIALGLWLGFLAIALTCWLAWRFLFDQQLAPVAQAVQQLAKPPGTESAASNRMFEQYQENLRKNEQQQALDNARSNLRNQSNPKCQFWLQQDQTAPSEKSRANVLQFCD